MNKLIFFLRSWTLPISMTAGVLLYPLMRWFTFLMPWLVFCILLLTFCRIPLNELRPRMLHLWLLLFQVGAGVGIWFLLKPFSIPVAEGVMVCILAPAGTATAVIAEKLGGHPASVTTHVVLSNFATAITVPLFFPFVHPLAHEPDFFAAFMAIFGRVVLVLILPLLASVFFRKYTPRIQARLVGMKEFAFYLWAFQLMVVTGFTADTVIHRPSDGFTEVWIALGALVACGLQFLIGKIIGSRYGQRTTGGQSLGQKNMPLALWISHAYLTPISAVAASAYLIWQNSINSWQLWKKRTAPSSYPPDGD